MTTAGTLVAAKQETASKPAHMTNTMTLHTGVNRTFEKYLREAHTSPCHSRMQPTRNGLHCILVNQGANIVALHHSTPEGALGGHIRVQLDTDTHVSPVRLLENYQSKPRVNTSANEQLLHTPTYCIAPPTFIRRASMETPATNQVICRK